MGHAGREGRRFRDGSRVELQIDLVLLGLGVVGLPLHHGVAILAAPLALRPQLGTGHAVGGVAVRAVRHEHVRRDVGHANRVDRSGKDHRRVVVGQVDALNLGVLHLRAGVPNHHHLARRQLLLNGAAVHRRDLLAVDQRAVLLFLHAFLHLVGADLAHFSGHDLDAGIALQAHGKGGQCGQAGEQSGGCRHKVLLHGVLLSIR